MQYFFILGRNPELSLAELHAVLPSDYKLRICSKEVAVVESPELKVAELMKRLGGTIKLGLVETKNQQLEIENAVLKLLTEFPKGKKLFLGLSAYALDNQVRLPTVRELREIGMELKRTLQEQGYKVRLVTSKEIALSSVIVKKEKLLTQGAEIVLFYSETKSPSARRLSLPTYIGCTLAVQEFEEASARDFGRPAREMRVGMLPIQLAKILINLARAPRDAIILDPFCGFGTILMEATQMGYKKLIGSDLERDMVDSTRKNLEWLTRVPPLRVRGGEEGLRNVHNPPQPSLTLREGVKLIVTPVEKLSEHLPPRSVDAIVTEPYLGPTRGMQNEELGIKNELTELYTKAFSEFSKILKPGGRVVFIFPAFRHGAQLTKTSTAVLPKIKNLGFTPIPLLPPTIHSSFSILYSRPNQQVLREIMVLSRP